jgi:hypothetical protein
MGTTIANPVGDVSVSVASRLDKYLKPLSRRRIQMMCATGVFKSAHKKGHGKNAQWFISGSEIIQHKMDSHAVLKY